MDELYREIILENWKNPQNYGVIEDADIDISDNNPLCGDEMRLTISVSQNKVKNILFISEGCAISKASASLFTEMVKEKSIKDIQQITPEEAITVLGVELTPTRTKCALLAYSTLKKGLNEIVTSENMRQ